MASKRKPPVVLITGPTASGKSALALRLAEQTRGVIVNADSAQIYRDLPILSAAPNAEDKARAEHRLYAILDGAEPCSAADWAEMAKHEFEAIHASNRLPILVGGTGLYLRTLLQGIAPVPAIDPKIRREIRGTPVDQNRLRLTQLDPDAAAKLKPADTTRIARALEVVLSTGRTLADWQQRREGGIESDIELRPLVILPPRDWLYRRCDERFSCMIDEGAAEEVGALLARKLDPDLPVMRAIGVREVAGWIGGEISREQAVATGQQATRRYAKRQCTWFEHQPPEDWRRFRDVPDAASLALLQGTV